MGHDSSRLADAVGNVYVADTSNHTIRKIARAGTNWVVTTIGGLDRIAERAGIVAGDGDLFGLNALPRSVVG